MKKYAHSDKNSPLVSKPKKIFDKFVDEMLEGIIKLDKKVNPDDIIYRYKGSTADEKFNEFDDALSLLDKRRVGKISLTDAKNNQTKYELNLNEIKQKNPKK